MKRPATTYRGQPRNMTSNTQRDSFEIRKQKDIKIRTKTRTITAEKRYRPVEKNVQPVSKEELAKLFEKYKSTTKEKSFVAVKKPEL